MNSKNSGRVANIIMRMIKGQPTWIYQVPRPGGAQPLESELCGAGAAATFLEYFPVETRPELASRAGLGTIIKNIGYTTIEHWCKQNIDGEDIMGVVLNQDPEELARRILDEAERAVFRERVLNGGIVWSESAFGYELPFWAEY